MLARKAAYGGRRSFAAAGLGSLRQVPGHSWEEGGAQEGSPKPVNGGGGGGGSEPVILGVCVCVHLCWSSS